MRYEAYLEDPLTGGVGEVLNGHLYVPESETWEQWGEDFTLTVRFAVEGKNNPLFVKLKTRPVRVQKIPLVMHCDGTQHLIRLTGVSLFCIEGDSIAVEATFKVLDNLGFLGAVQEERWYWGDHGKRKDESSK